MEVEHRTGQIRVQVLLDLDLAGPEVIRLELQGLLDNPVETQELFFRRVLAGEGEQVPHDPGHPLGFRGHGLEAPLSDFLGKSPSHEELAVAHDRGERVVDLVGHAGDELAQGGQLLRLEELSHGPVELLPSLGQHGLLGPEVGDDRRAPIGPGGGGAAENQGEQPPERPEPCLAGVESLPDHLLTRQDAHLPSATTQVELLRHWRNERARRFERGAREQGCPGVQHHLRITVDYAGENQGPEEIGAPYRTDHLPEEPALAEYRCGQGEPRGAADQSEGGGQDRLLRLHGPKKGFVSLGVGFHVETHEGEVWLRGIDPAHPKGGIDGGYAEAEGGHFQGTDGELVELFFGHVLTVGPEVGHLPQTDEVQLQSAPCPAGELAGDDAGVIFEVLAPVGLVTAVGPGDGAETDGHRENCCKG